MKEKVKGVLYDENSALMEWQEPQPVDLPGMIEAIKNIKESINDYMTHLVNKEKVYNIKDETEYFDANNEEKQEDVLEDRISGLIKEVATVSEKSTSNIKCKINYINQVKKIKK